jgi:hypothetical protein
VSADAARHSQLLALKLRALVREHTGLDAPGVPGSWPGGAALLRDGVAWVLAEDEPQRALGRALAWASHQGAATVHVLAERMTGLLARRASYFVPAPVVLHVEGRQLWDAVPEPFPRSQDVDEELLALRTLIHDGGADPIVEHGVLAGEVEGLEVCRAVRDELTGACRLEVGVGAHDREAFALLHGDVPAVEALSRVVAYVSQHRTAGADPHPLNRLAAERALRARLVREPGLAGAASLSPAPPPVPRANLKDAVPCVAAGQRPDGSRCVVVCSTGIDLDVVPFAADARAAVGAPDASLVIAVRQRDESPVTLALAARLARPASVIAVD